MNLTNPPFSHYENGKYINKPVETSYLKLSPNEEGVLDIII
jgi:hypothetical protein